MDAYSLDLRKKIVEAKERGMPTAEVAKTCSLHSHGSAKVVDLRCAAEERTATRAVQRVGVDLPVVESPGRVRVVNGKGVARAGGTTQSPSRADAR